MLKCDILDIQGLSPAIIGMRNPMNSWAKSDSRYIAMGKHYDDIQYEIGGADLTLMKNLFQAGTEHRKYLRMIIVWCDITAPLYWWKEFDTYKVGTVANSCSTMHKIHSKEFTMDDFSCEHRFRGTSKNHLTVLNPYEQMQSTISMLNQCRLMYMKTKDKEWWWQMIQILPSSYNQKRTVMLNYEVIARIMEQRSDHKLDEWHQLIDKFEWLPYMKEITS